MRIGELAALAGISTRAVRHYHQLGLLPEPRRLANGYREYGLRAAVELTRIRRLTELGLSLEEIRDVLADDLGRELREVLSELDADLAEQEREIGERRARLAQLLAADELHLDDSVSQDMAALLRHIPRDVTGLMAKERELLSLLDFRGGGDLLEKMSALAADQEYVARVQAYYAELDELAGAALDDPRLEVMVARLVELTPPELMPTSSPESWFAQALFDELPPAHAEVFRRAIAQMVART